MEHVHRKRCGTPMRHRNGQVCPCILPKGHQVIAEDSDHMDGHGHFAPVLVRQSSIREARRWQLVPFPWEVVS